MRTYYFDCFDEAGSHPDNAGMALNDNYEAAEQASGLLTHMLGDHPDTLGSHEVTILVRSSEGQPVYVAHGDVHGHMIPTGSN